MDRKRILIVDDELPIRSALARFFARDGWAVDAVADVAGALARLATGVYDVVLTDLRLGVGPDGWSVVGWVRSHTPDTPVAIITGLGGRQTQERAGREGVDAVFEKPIELAVLGRGVRALLTKHPVAA